MTLSRTHVRAYLPIFSLAGLLALTACDTSPGSEGKSLLQRSREARMRIFHPEVAASLRAVPPPYQTGETAWRSNVQPSPPPPSPAPEPAVESDTRNSDGQSASANAAVFWGLVGAAAIIAASRHHDNSETPTQTTSPSRSPDSDCTPLDWALAPEEGAFGGARLASGCH
jgi:hypothetical protein